MKIIHVSDYGEIRPNGVYSAVHALAQEQRRQGHYVIECTVWQTCVVDEETVFYTGKKKQFAQLVETYRPDIIVFNGLYPRQQISFSNYLKSKKIPYILVFHGGASCDNAKKHWFRKKVANYLFWNKFIHNAEKVVYLNENELMKSVFKRINSNFEIIPNGTDLKSILKKRVKKEKLNISFVSRLDYVGKGIDILINAMQILKNEGWDKKIHFSFYGSGDAEVTSKISAFDGFATCYGFVTGKQKEEAYMVSDLFILPSRSEGMPMCVLEALSYGVPCILTRQTNMVDIVIQNKCGWEINLSSESVVEVIKKAYNEIVYENVDYYNQCRSLAMQYSWQTIADKSLKLYSNITDKYYGKR